MHGPQNLCFTKKIRYESRKQLAKARPRVKGQFVRRDSSALDAEELEEGVQQLPEAEQQAAAAVLQLAHQILHEVAIPSSCVGAPAALQAIQKCSTKKVKWVQIQSSPEVGLMDCAITYGCQRFRERLVRKLTCPLMCATLCGRCCLLASCWGFVGQAAQAHDTGSI